MNTYASLTDAYIYLQPNGIWYFDDPVLMNNVAHAQQWEMLLKKISAKKVDIIYFNLSSTGKSISKTDGLLGEFYDLYFQGFPRPPTGNVYVGLLGAALMAAKRIGLFSAPITGNPGAGIIGTNLLEGELILSFLDTFREINGLKGSKEEHQKSKKGIASVNTAYIKNLSNFFLLGGSTYVGKIDFYAYDSNLSEKTLNQWWASFLEELSKSQTTNFGPVIWNVIFSPAKGLRIRGYFSIKTSGGLSDLNNRLVGIDAMWKSASTGQGYSSATVPDFQETCKRPHFLIAEDLLPGSSFRRAISDLNAVNKYFRPENFSGVTWGYKPSIRIRASIPTTPLLKNGMSGASFNVAKV